jgi:hypothetical protein
MGRQVDLDRARQEQQRVENEQKQAAAARAQQTSDLAAAHASLLASRENLGTLATEGANYLKQYGTPEAIPVDVANAYAQRAVSARKAHQAILDKIIGPVQDQRQQAQDLASKFASGQADPMDPKIAPTDLVKTITATARRPVQDFLGSPDQPAPVKQMVDDFRAGMQTQNEGLTLKALNGLFAPELKTGVGQPSPHGGVIVGKQIVKILPAPPGGPEGQDPNAGKVTPVLRVFVREGGPQAGVGETARMATNEQQQFGGPPGATGHYDAPVTQNRSSDPNDPIAHISMDDAMQRVSQMETLVSAMDHPELRAKVAQGLKEAGPAPQEFLNALYATGGTMPAKQETYENIPIGPRGTLRVTKNAQGKEIGREMLTGAPGATGGPLAKKLADIEAADLTPQQKEQAKSVAVGLTKVKAGSTAGAASAALGGATAPVKQDLAVDFWAKAVLAGDKDWQVGLSRGKGGAALIEAVKRRVPQMAKELGIEPADIGTTRATSVALSSTLKDLTKRTASIDLFADKLEKDMGTYDRLLSSAGSDSPLLLQKPINALRRQFSSDDLAQLDLAAKQVGTEYERLIQGGAMSIAQLHAGASEDAKKLINGDMTPKVARATMETMRAEMKNARESGHASLTQVQDQLRGLGKGHLGTPTAAPAKVSADDEALINKYLRK